jgi:ATP-binding cassette subfamily B protein
MAALRRRRLIGFLGPGLAELIIGAVRFGAILGLGAAFVRSGGATIGTVMAFFAFSGRLAAPIAGIQRFLASLREGAVSLSRLRELTTRMGTEETAPVPVVTQLSPAVGPPALVAEGLAYTYPGPASPALNDVTLALPRGRKIAVVGENGSGKTTLGLILGGLLVPSAGSVALVVSREAVPATGPAPPGPEVLYVPGEAFLFPGTARDNLQVGATPTDEELLEALLIAGADFVLASELGLDTPVAEDGGNLSAGQRQKLSIARALTRRPSFLVLDEATSSFDPPSEAALHGWLSDQDIGVCIINHNVKNVMWVNEVAVLAGGRAVERGKPEALLAKADSELGRLLRSRVAEDVGLANGPAGAARG